MILAEKVTVGGVDWIKVSIPKTHEVLTTKMKSVFGSSYNPKTKFWAIPYEYKASFELVMDEHLVVWKNQAQCYGMEGINEANIPDDPIVPYTFKTSPFPFQVKGFNELVSRNFLILADDMGLGKSLQAITAIDARKKLGHIKRGVIICKASLLYNWRDEIQKHSNLKGVVLAGTPQNKQQILVDLRFNDDWTFLIVSYETYLRYWIVINTLDNHKTLDFCVLDEAQKIKNPTSRIGGVLHYLTFKVKYVLTGTPLPNNPLEAYNYLKWGGVVTESWWDFKHRYGLWGGYRGRELVGYQNIQELRTLLQRNMLRRLKKDKLKDLPDVIFKTIPLEMLPQQASLYKAVKKEIIAELKDTTLTKIPSALAKLMRLQQITDSPALVGHKSEKSVKLDALDDLLGEITDSGEKAIVFSRFKTMVDIMEKRYKKYNPAIVHGEVATSGLSESTALKRSSGDQEKMDFLMTSKRQKEVYKFQGEPSCKVFIGTSGACKEGLTLTAANHVIFVDYEWNYASVEQAFSRAHRIGQKDAVTVYYLCCIGTVDEYVKGVVERKENMSQIMLGGEGGLSPHRARDFILDMLGEADREETA